MRVEILKPVPYSGAVVRSGVLDVSPAVGAHWIATGAGREAAEPLAEGTGNAPPLQGEGDASLEDAPATEPALEVVPPADPPPAPEAAPLEADDDEDAIHIPQPSFNRAPVHNRKGARR